MYYMGFYDLFDHLLEKNTDKGKYADTIKVSSRPNPKAAKVAGQTRIHQKTTPQEFDMATNAS